MKRLLFLYLLCLGLHRLHSYDFIPVFHYLILVVLFFAGV